MSRLDHKQRTITRTFRISEEWNEVLQVEANKQGVSVNVLVNKILRIYALFDRWADRYDTVALSPRTFRGILESATEDSLTKAGMKSGLEITDVFDEMGLTSDLNSFAYLIEEFLGGPDFARWFRGSHHNQEGEELFHLQHDLGRGWSSYLQAYLQSYLKSLNINDVEARVYDYALNLKVKNRRSRP